MVNWLKKYYLWVIISLFALLMLQTCRSCTKSSAITWTEVEMNTAVDSLNHEILIRDNRINELQSQVDGYESQIQFQQRLIESLKSDKEFLKESNAKLNTNLNKSLNKNEKSE